MNAVDSPVEALAFNYLSFAFSTAVNNIWAFVAVATAAVSFWKIRAAGPAKFHRPDHRRINESSSAVSTTATTVDFVLEEANDGCCDSLGRRRRLRRGKFTEYYDDENGGGEEAEEGDSTADDGGEEECDWGGDWKRGLRMRNGEDVSLGWYRYQDLTVLDGNVVKLWDGNLTNW